MGALIAALAVVVVGGTTATFSALTANTGSAVSANNVCLAAIAVPAYVDLTIDQSAPSGQDTTGPLVVKSSPGANKRALLRFAVPATPNGCQLDRATLRLTTNSGSSSGRKLRAYAASSDVNAGATWNSPPGRDTRDGAVFAMSVASGVLRFDVTPLIAADSANHGIVIQDSLEDGIPSGEVDFASSEDGTEANRPQLVISFVKP